MNKHISGKEEKELIEVFEFQKFTPELWAAKFGHNILCGDYRKNTFSDKQFEKWIHELFQILHTLNLKELRATVLTGEEIYQIEQEIANGF